MDTAETRPDLEVAYPHTDAWYEQWTATRDYPHIEVRMPSQVDVFVRQFGTITMATLRIGGVTFMHQPGDMRMLLLAALEQLDQAEVLPS